MQTQSGFTVSKITISAPTTTAKIDGSLDAGGGGGGGAGGEDSGILACVSGAGSSNTVQVQLIGLMKAMVISDWLRCERSEG